MLKSASLIKPTEVGYLECICSSDNDLFLLTERALRLRNEIESLTVSRNVGCTLLYYEGEYFPPVPAASQFKRALHGERVSLTEVIKSAIREKWGPFKTLTKNPNDIPIAFSIENIKQDSNLLLALQELDGMKVFSERAFCYYRNDKMDQGCLPYFSFLEELIGKNKILLFHALPIQKEGPNRQQLEIIIKKLQSQQKLIDQKLQLIREKKQIEASFKEDVKQHKTTFQEVLAKKREQYSKETDPEKQSEIMNEIRRIQVEHIRELRRKRDEKLAELDAKEEKINQQLRVAFGLTSAASTYMPSKPIIQRKGLGNIPLVHLIRDHESFVLGTAVDDGGCFFDGLAQKLNVLQKTNQHSEKSLRMVCYTYYMENKEAVDELFKGQNEGSTKEYDKVLYTKPELDEAFDQTAPIWGRPHIEGVILCRALNLQEIVVLESLIDPITTNPVPKFIKITPDGISDLSIEEGNEFIRSQKSPVLVGSQGELHFVPLFSDEQLKLQASLQEEKKEDINLSSSHKSLADRLTTAKRIFSESEKPEQEEDISTNPIFAPRHSASGSSRDIVTPSLPAHQEQGRKSGSPQHKKPKISRPGKRGSKDDSE